MSRGAEQRGDVGRGRRTELVGQVLPLDVDPDDLLDRPLVEREAGNLLPFVDVDLGEEQPVGRRRSVKCSRERSLLNANAPCRRLLAASPARARARPRRRCLGRKHAGRRDLSCRANACSAA